MRFRIVGLNGEEIVAVPHGLDENERAVEHERHQPGEDELRRAVARTEFEGHKVWKDQRQSGERGQHRERRTCALDLKSLFAMMRAAPQEAGADDAVAHDHDGGEHRVAGEPGFFGRRGDHHRDDQCRLNDRDRQSEDQRAERLADAVRHHFGVVHGRKHRGEQHDAGRRGDETPAAEKK